MSTLRSALPATLAPIVQDIPVDDFPAQDAEYGTNSFSFIQSDANSHE